MATSQAAYAAEKIIGHGQENLKQDISNYNDVGGPNETMKALVWQGKKKVEIGAYIQGPVTTLSGSSWRCTNRRPLLSIS